MKSQFDSERGNNTNLKLKSMNDDFAPFELAVKLKEKGFDKECLCHYVGEDLVYNIESPIANNQLWFSHNKFDNIWHRDNYDAPTISQVLKWLREEKKIYLEIVIVVDAEYMCDIYKISPRPIECLGSTEYFLTYEKAAIAGINYVLDNLI